MNKPKGEFYISFDCECFGPCPGLHSMVQMGAVFYDFNGRPLVDMTCNIEELPDTARDPETMAWWEKQKIEQPGIWERLMTDRVDPKAAMLAFEEIVESVEAETKCRPVVVSYPATFDFGWLYYYLHRFTGRSCVGFSGLDIKTLTLPFFMDKGYRGYGKKDMPAHWFDTACPHTHDALQDSIGQGHMFFKIMRDLKGLTDKSRSQ